jgi:tellurite resistance protein TerC
MMTMASWWMWAAFAGIVALMLVLDLGVFHRRAHAVTMREATIWTFVWISVALAFNVGVWVVLGQKTALEFFTGYIVEEALSVDNLFVFFIIFSYFKVPAQLQHRVLFWGVLGAFVIRLVFIFVGVALITKFHWLTWVLGGFLIWTGLKILFGKDEEVEPEHNPAMKLIKRFIPLTHEYHGTQFIARIDGRRVATPMFVVLCIVEFTDIVFAADSIPAVLAITHDPFIVATSNIFAILGLRTLYFLIARIIDRLHYLKIGLGVVLAFVGVKMVVAEWYKLPIQASLGIIVGVLALSAIASFARPKPPAPPN